MGQRHFLASPPAKNLLASDRVPASSKVSACPSRTLPARSQAIVLQGGASHVWRMRLTLFYWFPAQSQVHSASFLSSWSNHNYRAAACTGLPYGLLPAEPVSSLKYAHLHGRLTAITGIAAGCFFSQVSRSSLFYHFYSGSPLL